MFVFKSRIVAEHRFKWGVFFKVARRSKKSTTNESQRKRKRGEKKSSSSRFYYIIKNESYLWSETWSQRPRHALRGEDVRFLRLDPPESLFGALFLLSNKEKSVRRDVCFPISSMRFFPPPQKHHSAKNKSTRTKKMMINSYLDDQKRSPVLVECEGHDEMYSSLVYKSGWCVRLFLSEGVLQSKKFQKNWRTNDMQRKMGLICRICVVSRAYSTW